MQKETLAPISSLILDRVPPQSLDAERSVLGSILINKEAFPQVSNYLAPEAFYKEAHSKIYQTMNSLYARNEPVDLITVSNELAKNGYSELTGGHVYLTELVSSIPTAANVEYHAKIVKEKWLLRELIKTGTEVASAAYDSSEDSEILLDRAEQKIFSLAQKGTKEDFLVLKDMIHSSIEMVESLYQRKSHITGVSSGFPKFDELTAGFQSSELIIVAARPGDGKTSFCLQVAMNAALTNKTPVAIFSIEMSAEPLILRMLSSLAKVDLKAMMRGWIAKEGFGQLITVAGMLAEAPIYIDDSSDISVMDIRAKARKLKSHVPLGLIVVDYLQLIRTRTSRVENRQQEVAEISRGLKGLAKDLKIPVIAVSQLSRGPEHRREDSEPRLSDLRESGALEQDADLVVFIINRQPPGTDLSQGNEVQLKIAKQRNGPTGSINMFFHKKFTRFESLDSTHQPPQ